MKISNNKVVTVNYTMKNSKGEVLDSSAEHEALCYVQGSGEVISGLEKAVEGKTKGDKLSIIVPPEDAYGLLSEDDIEELPLSSFEDPEEIEVGTEIEVEYEDDIEIAVVTKIEGDKVTVDFNHPLAGETLYLDLEVIEVREATEEELKKGHTHKESCGCGCSCD